MKKSLYDILGVPADAAPQEVKEAYEQRLAQLPESDNVTRMALKEAWHVLSSPSRRASYDASLQPLVVPIYEEDEKSRRKISRAVIWLLVPLVVAVGLGFYKMRSKPVPAETVVTRVVSVDQALSQQKQPLVASATVISGTGTSNAGNGLSPVALFEKASASVVRINTTDIAGMALGVGSGVVIGDGLVITNCHVARTGPRIVVKHGNDQYDARIDRVDDEFDLCRLAVFGLRAPAVSIGRSSSLKVGQKVFAIGSPQGLDLTLSDGLVSALRTTNDVNVIQTSAPVSQGSSGGGLFTETGELVGIVTFQMKNGQNLNFAVAAEHIVRP